MSEYQCYDFRAIDRPLSEKEMAVLRASSTRARITPTRFVNEYAYGDFRGDEGRWMERYFDACVYVASWGTRRLQLRVPAPAIDLREARRYCADPDWIDVRKTRSYAVVRFESDQEGGDGWVEDDEARLWLTPMLGLRAELAGGDRRALYLGWLAWAQFCEREDDTREPPVPPGLDKLSAPLRTLAKFLRIDRDVMAVAAKASPAQPARTMGAMRAAADERRERRDARA